MATRTISALREPPVEQQHKSRLSLPKNRHYFSTTRRQASSTANLEDDDLDESSTSNAATATETTTTTHASDEPPLHVPYSEYLHPDKLNNGTIPYPEALSPSAIMEFKKCPQSFLFQYLYKIKQPTSQALAKGSMCHSALENIFDLEPEDRTLEHLQNFFRSNWSKNRRSDTYRILFEREEGQVPDWDTDAEREWGKSGLKLLENYYKLEDPRQVVRPNPVKREMWLRADLSVDPSQGVTAEVSSYNDDDDTSTCDPDTPTFHVRGIVDRLDMVRARDSGADSKVCLRIVDYKTGKAPNLKYSPAMNQQIMEEAFFQLKIYALLLREKGAGRQFEFSPNKMHLRYLRLLYLTSESGKAINWDMDMGATEQERDALLQEVHQELAQVWMDIVELVSTQDPKAFVGCDRSFCYCHKCREKFVPGSVWEPKALP